MKEMNTQFTINGASFLPIHQANSSPGVEITLANRATVLFWGSAAELITLATVITHAVSGPAQSSAITGPTDQEVAGDINGLPPAPKEAPANV